MPKRLLRSFVARFAFYAVAVSLVATSLTVAESTVAPTASEAADLSKFQAGNIISDSLFFNPNTMTVSQIQSFLNSKVPSCASGYTCLKSYKQTTRSIAADPMCTAYTGAENETAATIIYRVAQSCGISPKVILVMLQKEQSLVTSTAPSSYKYRSAMGAGCPDTAACDSRYYGFFNQVRYGAYLLKRYTQPAGTGAGTPWYTRYDLVRPVGKTSPVLYHPNSACGTKSVYIANQATHSLYLYTPYTPNTAALNAGYGIGNSCSAYGNRNFFQFYTDWFGSTQATSSTSTDPAVSGTATVGETLTANPGTYTGLKTGVSAKLLKSKHGKRTYNGHRIMSIQYALNRGGFRTTIDGFYGKKTTANVKAYQRKFGLSVDGRVGPVTWRHMESLVHATPVYSFAWLSCSSEVTSVSKSEPSGCSTIADQTQSTLEVGAGQSGRYIVAKITAKNTAGTASRWTKSTAAVTATPTNTVTPSLDGSGAIDSTLTANPGTWTGAPTPTLSYSWFLCTSAVAATSATLPAGCSALDGATAASYVPSAEQAGSFLSARVTATNSVSAASVWTASVAVTP